VDAAAVGRMSKALQWMTTKQICCSGSVEIWSSEVGKCSWWYSWSFESRERELGSQ
jgi:hypothetical protein